jgi:hypothetical protein
MVSKVVVISPEVVIIGWKFSSCRAKFSSSGGSSRHLAQNCHHRLEVFVMPREVLVIAQKFSSCRPKFSSLARSSHHAAQSSYHLPEDFVMSPFLLPPVDSVKRLPLRSLL